MFRLPTTTIFGLIRLHFFSQLGAQGFRDSRPLSGLQLGQQLTILLAIQRQVDRPTPMT